jgi:hypothetical protein
MSIKRVSRLIGPTDLDAYLSNGWTMTTSSPLPGQTVPSGGVPTPTMGAAPPPGQVVQPVGVPTPTGAGSTPNLATILVWKDIESPDGPTPFNPSA